MLHTHYMYTTGKAYRHGWKMLTENNIYSTQHIYPVSSSKFVQSLMCTHNFHKISSMINQDIEHENSWYQLRFDVY